MPSSVAAFRQVGRWASEMPMSQGAVLESLLGAEHGLESHIQKAWPVIFAQHGGEVELHIYRNAQLSAMF